MKILTALLLTTATAMAQGNDTRIGDDYARAALRVVIYTRTIDRTVDRVAALTDEADVQSSTPAEETSFKTISHILYNWLQSAGATQSGTACYVALKANLKARSGVTPDAC